MNESIIHFEKDALRKKMALFNKVPIVLNNLSANSKIRLGNFKLVSYVIPRQFAVEVYGIRVLFK